MTAEKDHSEVNRPESQPPHAEVAIRIMEIARKLGIDPHARGAAKLLSDKAKVTRQAASAWLRGLSVPRTQVAMRLETFADYPLGFILKGAPRPPEHLRPKVRDAEALQVREPDPDIMGFTASVAASKDTRDHNARLSALLSEIEVAAFYGQLGPHQVERLEQILRTAKRGQQAFL